MSKTDAFVMIDMARETVTCTVNSFGIVFGVRNIYFCLTLEQLEGLLDWANDDEILGQS